MYVFKGINIYKYNIDINVVNLIIIHVLIILPMLMFNISRYVQVNKYGDWWISYTPLYLLQVLLDITNRISWTLKLVRYHFNILLIFSNKLQALLINFFDTYSFLKIIFPSVLRLFRIIYRYKVVISVCLSVCLSGTPDLPHLWLGNSGEPWKCS